LSVECRALIVGGSKGLGYAAAEALAEEGCKLAVTARSVEDLERARMRLLAAGASSVFVKSVDHSRKEGAEALVPWALEVLGELDFVLLAYGNPRREPLEIHEALWDDWMEAASIFLALTGTVIRDLVSLNPVKATLVMVSSFTVAEPMSPLVVSDAARAGLTRIARVAARRYPGRLRPLVVMVGSFPTPGAMETIRRIAEARGDDPQEVWRREVESLSPLGRAGMMGEWKWLVKTLLRAPEYLHGAVIQFDGGTGRASIP